jgi:predicted nucleic acid-binding protein
MSGKNALLDSNVFIYISQKQLDFEKLLAHYDNFYTSVISKMEVLGYNFDSQQEKEIVENLFKEIEILNLNEDIVNNVIETRKKRKIKLPDAIVYATASTNDIDLITRNVDDFKNIDKNIKVINPFDYK